MKEWRFIPLEVNDGYWNMALDEAILKSIIERESPHTIRLYKWKPSTISIGRNQSLNSEVDVEIAQKKGFNIVRRITGGGAVFHDEEGEITYAITCPLKFLENLGAHTIIDQFELIESGIIAGLNHYGLNAQKGIIHCPALFLEGKKFSGNAQSRKKGFLLQHGTILLRVNPELMYSVLKAPNNISTSKMVRSVYAKVTGLKEYFNKWSEKEFLNSLKIGFEKVLGIKLIEGYYSNNELKMARFLVKNKYRNENWTEKYE